MTMSRLFRNAIRRRVDVDLRRLVDGRDDHRRLAVDESMRLAVELPDIRHLRAHQLERRALDCAVGDGARLRERHRVAHGQRLGAHAEREAARDAR